MQNALLVQGLDLAPTASALNSAITNGPTRKLQNQLLDTQAQDSELMFKQKDAVNDAFEARRLLGADPQAALEFLAQRREKVLGRGGNTRETDAIANAIQNGNIEGASKYLDAVIDQGQQLGILGRTGSVASKDRAALLNDIKPALDESGNFDPKRADARALSAARELNIIPKPGTYTAPERIGNTPGQTDIVADSQEKIDNSKAYGSASGKGAAALDSLSDQWEANREFIVSAIPGIQDVLEESPGSSLGKAASTFLSKSVGGLDSVDAQAELEQFGAILLQGVPFAPGAQSDKELQARAKLVSDQLEDPNISPAKKIEILGRFIDFQDARASAQRRISERKRGKSGEKPKEQRSSAQPSSFTSSSGIQFTVE